MLCTPLAYCDCSPTIMHGQCTHATTCTLTIHGRRFRGQKSQRTFRVACARDSHVEMARCRRMKLGIARMQVHHLFHVGGAQWMGRCTNLLDIFAFVLAFHRRTALLHDAPMVLRSFFFFFGIVTCARATVAPTFAATTSCLSLSLPLVPSFFHGCTCTSFGWMGWCMASLWWVGHEVASLCLM